MQGTIVSYMNNQITLRLNADADQLAGLMRLQAAFATVCTTLGPIVQQTRCWNRVTLHHLAYRSLREKFPDMGSQMICNAIYSVSRSARDVYQHASSPWSIEKRPNLPLPLLTFSETAPVYFDRHTLSLRKGRLSMFTLEGRMRFDIGLTEIDEQRFRTEKLREIVLTRDAHGFLLVFCFGNAEESIPENKELPEYLVVIEPETLAA